jgi:CRP/FNR family cyclic AMP-dependent transcriptional regulator
MLKICSPVARKRVLFTGMDASNTGNLYKIWGVDEAVYGPVELPTLVAWIKDERVTAHTWLYSQASAAWLKAADVPELKLFFRKQAGAPASPAPAGLPIKAGGLRRVKILADFTEVQLEQFVQHMEVKPIRQWTEIVRQGEPGDGMYLILEGELRVRLMVGGKETTLATLQAGEFFGEISLFDTGPRSADVVANKDCILLKIGAEPFSRIVVSAPELAAPFLFAVGKTLTARIRADNKRFRDAVAFARTADSGAPAPASPR